MKTLIWLIVIVLIVLGIYYVVSSPAPSPTTGNATSTAADASPSVATDPAAQAVVAAAAIDYGVPDDQVVLLTLTRQTWPNVCLGIAASSTESCAQVVTPGAEITLTVNGETHIYPASQDGTSVRRLR